MMMIMINKSQISALNNPYRVDISLNKWAKPNLYMIVILINYLKINEISALNNPHGVDMPLNRPK